jgi:hypothetical protein
MPRLLRGFCLLAIPAVFAMGCRERDEIRTYKVPKLVETPKEIRDSIVEYRLIGAIIPAGDGSSVFFKTQGPQADLAPHEAAIGQLFQSIKFPNGPTQNPTWDVPTGWKEDRTNPNRIATLTMNESSKPLILTVTKFQGSVIDNTNRWRRMVGATEVDESELAKVTTAFKTGTGQEAWRVDARGRKNPDDGMRAMGMPGGR